MNKIVRTHMTSELNLKLIKTDPVDQKNYTFKPKGLWYAIGDAWIDWCKSEMPDWIQLYMYTFNILANNNMLYLNTPELVKEFSKQYGREVFRYLREINWKQVNKDYDGVEFNPYFYDQRFAMDTLWYNGIDVPSGVIFNTDIIENLKCHDLKIAQTIKE